MANETTYQFQPVTSLGPSLSVATKEKSGVRSSEVTQHSPGNVGDSTAFSPFPLYLPDPPLTSLQHVHLNPRLGRVFEKWNLRMQSKLGHAVSLLLFHGHQST